MGNKILLRISGLALIAGIAFANRWIALPAAMSFVLGMVREVVFTNKDGEDKL